MLLFAISYYPFHSNRVLYRWGQGSFSPNCITLKSFVKSHHPFILSPFSLLRLEDEKKPFCLPVSRVPGQDPQPAFFLKHCSLNANCSPLVRLGFPLVLSTNLFPAVLTEGFPKGPMLTCLTLPPQEMHHSMYPLHTNAELQEGL